MFERSTLRPRGATVGIQPNGIRALEAIDPRLAQRVQGIHSETSVRWWVLAAAHASPHPPLLSDLHRAPAVRWASGLDGLRAAYELAVRMLHPGPRPTVLSRRPAAGTTRRTAAC